jgi:hypothetical protein
MTTATMEWGAGAPKTRFQSMCHLSSCQKMKVGPQQATGEMTFANGSSHGERELSQGPVFVATYDRNGSEVNRQGRLRGRVGSAPSSESPSSALATGRSDRLHHAVEAAERSLLVGPARCFLEGARRACPQSEP